MIEPFKGGQRLRVIFALLAFLAAAFSSLAQPGGLPAGIGGEFPKLAPEKEPGFTMGVSETDAQIYSTDVTGSPVINPHVDRRDAFSKVQIRGGEYAQLGDSTTMTVGTGVVLRPLFGFTDELRRFNRARPTNSIIEAGPLYVVAQDLTAAMLVSDNVNFTPNNAHWGAIAELRLRIAGILQIAPAWRLIVSGSIIYLPFDNEFGLEGFGIGDAFGFIADETLRPVTHMQLAYNSRWADWNVQFVDDFAVNYLSIGGNFDYFARGLAEPEGVHAEDRVGRYVFANGTTIPTTDVNGRQNDRLDVRTYLELRNIVAGSANRLLPTETRVAFGASHSDVWFEGNADTGTNGLGFSNYSVDRVFAELRNERESMRFKPFAYYDAYRYNYDPNWTHQAGGGITGPITDNLFLHASGGYTWGASLQKNTEFYRIALVNTPNAYTRQMVEYSRVLTEPVREIRDTYRYAIHEILGPHLEGRMILRRSVYQPNQPGVYESVEDRAAARIFYEPTRRHTVIIGGFFTENRFANPSRDRETTWEGRAELVYQWSATLKMSLLYRYLAIDTKRGSALTETAENLWVLSARKYF